MPRRPSKVTRSYELQLLPNPGKAEHIRYAQYWYRHYTLDYCAKYYDQGPVKKPVAESTAGLGWIANQAQQRARSIINAGFAAEKVTDNPFHCPTDFPLLCGGRIEADKKGTQYAYWVKPPTCPKIPAQTHRALNNALRRGGKLRPTCEVKQGKHGEVQPPRSSCWLYFACLSFFPCFACPLLMLPLYSLTSLSHNPV